MSLPDNLPAILRGFGLHVEEEPGWRGRSVPGPFAPVGVLCHHTATSRAWTEADLNRLLVKGRSDLPGPLCELRLKRDGTVRIIAAGRANHGGDAKASGTVAAGNANTLYIGIEADNDGVGEPWPKVQMDAYVLLAAVLSLKVTGNSWRTVRGHKETSVTGKIDPTFDMDRFRGRVAATMRTLGRPPQPPPPPPEPPKPTRLSRARDLLWAIAESSKGGRRAAIREALRKLPPR